MASTILGCTAPNFPNDQGQRLCPGCAQMHTPVFTHHPPTLTLSTNIPSPHNYPISITNINPQTLSPLYQIPSELRTLIFTYVFLAVPDPSQPYSHTTRTIFPQVHHPRQSYPYCTTIHTTLLLTCKQVYFPNRHLPISLNPHVFWPRDYREPILPSHASYPIHTAPYFKRLLPWQQKEVKEVRFNIPEQLMGNVINQKIARAFLKKKTTGLMDEEVDLGGLRVLVWDCHNPVFWEGAGEGRFEGKREGMMGVNYGEVVELFRQIEGLREMRVIIDWRRGSKVWDFVKGLDFGHLKLVDDGSGGDGGEQEGEEGTPNYRLRTLRFVG